MNRYNRRSYGVVCTTIKRERAAFTGGPPSALDVQSHPAQPPRYQPDNSGTTGRSRIVRRARRLRIKKRAALFFDLCGKGDMPLPPQGSISSVIFSPKIKRLWAALALESRVTRLATS